MFDAFEAAFRGAIKMDGISPVEIAVISRSSVPTAYKWLRSPCTMRLDVLIHITRKMSPKSREIVLKALENEIKEKN